MDDVRFVTLAKLANSLNEKNVRWALGGSALLFIKGIAFQFNNFDIVVEKEDRELSCKALDELNAQKRNDEKPSKTKVVDKYNLDGIDVDVISSYVINAYGVDNDCSFRNENVEDVEIKGVTVKLDSLESWYNIYQLRGKIEKARYIKDYLLYHK